MSEILEIPISSRQKRRKVEICHVDGRFFASKSDSAYLESDARVSINRSAPSTTGSAPFSKNNWQFNSNLCPILAELVAVLVEFGFADVFRLQMTSSESAVATTSSESGFSKIPMKMEEIPFPDDREFRIKRLVVRDFWRKGYFLADGTRFGGDYLVYTKSPNQCHAEFVLLCTPCSDEKRISAMRCCNQVKKTLILATTPSGDNLKPHYTKCEWFRPELF
ncbi:hypothetical protein L5515_012601 [Caenorhabditis briggsae]|uniref:tRNA-intron lyase n=1 Tax=Caenorhabditis briggsae TaxID=6238 RepID=A0AAE9EZY2_CAEBR|nr:hypothetical protein L5515_012601 [Caenorhabditis briggsae]